MPTKKDKRRRTGDGAFRKAVTFRVTDDDYNMIRQAKPRGMTIGEFLREATMRYVREVL